MCGQAILVVLTDRNQAMVARLSRFLTKTTAILTDVRFFAGVLLVGTYEPNGVFAGFFNTLTQLLLLAS